MNIWPHDNLDGTGVEILIIQTLRRALGDLPEQRNRSGPPKVVKQFAKVVLQYAFKEARGNLIPEHLWVQYRHRLDQLYALEAKLWMRPSDDDDEDEPVPVITSH